MEELKTVTLRVNCDRNASTVSRRGLEGVLAGVVATGRKLITSRVRELERLAIRTNEGVRNRVEGEVTSEGHCSYNIWGGDESVGGRVSIVTASEVTVVGGNN